MNIHNVEFVISAVSSKNFIRDGRPQIVFAGRSNVGKSSTINRLLNRKNFARVGSAPGKTVHINYFDIDSAMYFVDLPGYGFAKVTKAEKDRRAKLIQSYFDEPELVSVGVLIVDARHKPTADDVTMAQWFIQTGAPFIVAANKIDKCKKSEIEGNLQRITETLGIEGHAELIAFSAETGAGKAELFDRIITLGGVKK
ncbi:MAG: YihA family ribosome biogenesis GTP-binding protein [Oscillospiraceae bacterium]|nr:YihA family ribosome biogenesis GTP-binding protein [Oscillospiraceae bacterium]